MPRGVIGVNQPLPRGTVELSHGIAIRGLRGVAHRGAHALDGGAQRGSLGAIVSLVAAALTHGLLGGLDTRQDTLPVSGGS